MQSHSFQVKKFKLYRNVNDSSGQVVERFTILPYPREVRNKGLITQKMWFRRAFAQFPRYRVEIAKERQRIPVAGHGEVDASTLPP